jgi:uncharacterized protein YdaU (DUF1376 family)
VTSDAELLELVQAIERRLDESALKKLLAEWFWADRYDGSSAALLPMEAQGVYRSMLTQAWRRGAKLPNDHVAIQRAIRCTAAEWDRTWPAIQRYWRVAGPHLVNETQLGVYVDALDAADEKKARARNAANARWERERARAFAQAHAQAVPEHMLVQCSPVSGLRSNELTTTPLKAPPCENRAEQRQRRRDCLAVADELLRFYHQLLRAHDPDEQVRRDGLNRKDLAGKLETGRYTREQLHGSICEMVRDELLMRGLLASSAAWPPAGLAPYDARGSPPIQAAAASPV